MIVAASTTLLAGGDTTVVSHSHTVPAVPAGLGCPVAAGAADVGEDAADGEPDPQAAASKDSAAARMTPARAPGLIRPCPQLMDDPQVPFAEPLPAPQVGAGRCRGGRGFTHLSRMPCGHGPVPAAP